MVSEHMLTVGRDPRNWKAIGNYIAQNIILKKKFHYFSSFLSFYQTLPLTPNKLDYTHATSTTWKDHLTLHREGQVIGLMINSVQRGLHLVLEEWKLPTTSIEDFEHYKDSKTAYDL